MPTNEAEELKQLIEEIRAILGALDGVKTPELKRPDVPHGQPPTQELVHWTIRVYAYSLLCQFREVLRSALYLYEAGQVPAVFLCCRSLYEMAAHSYYVKKHAFQYLAKKDFKAAWELMVEVNQGSRHMREKQKDGKLPANVPQLEEGPHIAKVINCFDEYFREQGDNVARKNYSFLSEFCHPNSFAFTNHLDYTDDKAGVTVTFTKPSPEICIQVIPDAWFSCMPLIFSLSDLLNSIGDKGLNEARAAFIRVVSPEDPGKVG